MKRRVQTKTAAQRKYSSELTALREKVVEANALIQSLISGQVDAVMSPTTGPVLLAKAQEALRLSEQRYRLIVETAFEGIWVIDVDSKTTFVNQRMADLLGYTVQEMIGRPAREFFHVEDQPRLETRVQERRRGTRSQHEVRFRSKSGADIWGLVAASPIHAPDGSYQGVLGMVSDLTERRRAEERVLQADRMAAIGLLAAGVAHEINNPLAYVIANLGYLGKELAQLHRSGVAVATVDEMLEALKETQDGAERVRGIVRDLKMFSRSEDVRRAPVDLHNLLNSTANMAWNEIRHSARLVKDYSLECLFVDGSESRLGQVFLNLLVNAAQAIQDGSADANEIRLKTSVRADGRVTIEVRDTGPGIAPEIRARLFTPFLTTKPAGVGTGLGLSICQNIVAQHGGEIQVETEVGRGTTVRVFLPPSTEREPESAPTPTQGSQKKRGRILVVDDELFVGVALRRMLRGSHDVEVVGNGRDALVRLACGPGFDVVVCDLMMPEMSGVELFKHIRDEHPKLSDRVIFSTGGAFTESARSFLESVPNLRIEKPFNVDQLAAAVAGFLALN